MFNTNVVPNTYTHTHTHTHTYTHARTAYARTHRQMHAHMYTHTHTHTHAHTHMLCLQHTHTHTHCLAQTKHRDTHRHTLPRGSVVFDPTVSVFWKVTVNFSPLPTPLQCPSPLSTALLAFAPFEDIHPVIFSKPISEPHDCSGLVHLCGCVCTRAAAGMCRTHLASYSVGVQFSTQAAAHTCQVKALEFSSQRKRQQERAYHPNNHTRVQTQGLSQSSSALLPPLGCWIKLLTPIKNGWIFNSCIFFAGNFEFWSQKSIFFEKKAHTLRVTKGRWGWLVGLTYGLLFGIHVTVKN